MRRKGEEIVCNHSDKTTDFIFVCVFVANMIDVAVLEGVTDYVAFSLKGRHHLNEESNAGVSNSR